MIWKTIIEFLWKASVFRADSHFDRWNLSDEASAKYGDPGLRIIERHVHAAVAAGRNHSPS